VSGRFAVLIGDEEGIITPGDSFYCAPDVVHGVTALEAGRLIDTFTPIREDFLSASK
jgi:quercetin dioxygenase-like cupin family protein